MWFKLPSLNIMRKSTYLFLSALLILIKLNPQDKKINIQLNVVSNIIRYMYCIYLIGCLLYSTVGRVLLNPLKWLYLHKTRLYGRLSICLRCIQSTTSVVVFKCLTKQVITSCVLTFSVCVGWLEPHISRPCHPKFFVTYNANLCRPLITRLLLVRSHKRSQ